MSAASSPPRYRWLDSLRALAAYLVIWLHVAHCYSTYTPQVHAQGTGWFDLAWDIDVGRWAVTLFFIISGFVIPSSLRGPRWPALRKFVVRRFWRLYPAFWLSVVAGAVCCVWMWGDSMSPARWLANLTMVPSWFGQQPVMGPYWTLSIELIFYALCCLAWMAGCLHSTLWLTLATLLFGSAGPWLFQSERFLGAGLSEPAVLTVFSLGWMHWGALYRKWHESGRSTGHIALALALTAGWLMVGPVQLAVSGWTRLQPDSLRLGTGYTLGLLSWLLGSTRFRVESARLSWLGEISYSLYLLHTPIYFFTSRVLRYGPVPGILSHLYLGVYVVVHFVLTTWLADLAYRKVEKPAIELGHRLTRTPMVTHS